MRWNSALMMAESVLDLKKEVQNALKKLGHFWIVVSVNLNGICD